MDILFRINNLIDSEQILRLMEDLVSKFIRSINENNFIDLLNSIECSGFKSELSEIYKKWVLEIVKSSEFLHFNILNYINSLSKS